MLKGLVTHVRAHLHVRLLSYELELAQMRVLLRHGNVLVFVLLQASVRVDLFDCGCILVMWKTLMSMRHLVRSSRSARLQKLGDRKSVV